MTDPLQTDSGLTVFLVPRGEGVETKPVKTLYSAAAGTAYITFEDVKVSDEWRLGPEGGGIFVILSNFNVSRSIFGNRKYRLTLSACSTSGERPSLSTCCHVLMLL